MNEKNTDNQIPKDYLRITQLLSVFTDFSHIEPAVLARAADRGTRVHQLCESYVKSKSLHASDFVIDSADSDCKPYLLSFVEWFESMVEKVVYTELRINDERLKLSGQCDLIAVLKGDTAPTIIDIKTPQQTQKSWQLQTAAYRLLAERKIGLELEGKELRRITLILDKYGGKARVTEYTDGKGDIQKFLNLLELYRFFNE